MAKYKIHFIDRYGAATIICDTDEEYAQAMRTVKNDPEAEDVWVEYYDPYEGWQA